MTATAHALIGGAIAASVPDPALGLSLSLISHPLMDLIPHWDFGWGWKKKDKKMLFLESAFDLGLGVGVSYLLFGQNINLQYFLGCVLLTEIWDLLEAPYWFFNWKFPPFSSIYNIQHKMQGKAKTILGGIFTQIITVAVVVFVLSKL